MNLFSNKRKSASLTKYKHQVKRGFYHGKNQFGYGKNALFIGFWKLLFCFSYDAKLRDDILDDI